MHAFVVVNAKSPIVRVGRVLQTVVYCKIRLGWRQALLFSQFCGAEAHQELWLKARDIGRDTPKVLLGWSASRVGIMVRRHSSMFLIGSARRYQQRRARKL